MLILIFAILCGLVYMFRGGNGLGPIRPSDIVGSQVFKLVFGFLLALPVLAMFSPIWVYILAGVLCTVMVTTGHGSALDMGRTEYNDPDELISTFIQDFLNINYDTVLHDFLYMFISGCSYFLPVFVMSLFTGNIGAIGLMLVFMGISGLFKASAYFIAWLGWDAYWNAKIDYDFNKDPLGYAEFLYGFLQGFVIYAAASICF